MSRFSIVVVCSIFSIQSSSAIDYNDLMNSDKKNNCAPAALVAYAKHRRSASDETKPPLDIDGIRDPKSPSRK